MPLLYCEPCPHFWNFFDVFQPRFLGLSLVSYMLGSLEPAWALVVVALDLDLGLDLDPAVPVLVELDPVVLVRFDLDLVRRSS